MQTDSKKRWSESGQLGGLSTGKNCRLPRELSVCRIPFYLELNPADDCDYLPISCFSKASSMILHGGRGAMAHTPQIRQ